MAPVYPKRLIEVDLPIKRISVHARREKSIRHGHISTLHIWWARRPLAACRAVILAALWPDPADPLCPERFRKEAADRMRGFRDKHGGKQRDWDDPKQVRAALLDFIADFANWDNSNNKDFLETSRALVQVAHEALGGMPGTRPLVVDPFAGGGAIPLEALRVGADAFASDLNPVAVLLNKVVLEYIPKHGEKLAEEVLRWGEWVQERAKEELARFYPMDEDGAVPIAYLWARTIQCEGPGCGAKMPLMRSYWLAKKGERQVAIQPIVNTNKKSIDFRIIIKTNRGWKDQLTHDAIENPIFHGTLKRGSATCPLCGYTVPVSRVREQLKEKRGGVYDAILYCVVATRPGKSGRNYRLPDKRDIDIANMAQAELSRRKGIHKSAISFVPGESTKSYHSFVNRGPIYGMTSWEDYYLPRQALSLGIIASCIRDIESAVLQEDDDVSKEFLEAIQTCLALSLGRLLDLSNSLCGWTLDTQCVKNLFRRQAIPMVWNFAEGVCIGDSAGSWSVVVNRFPRVLKSMACNSNTGIVQQADAAQHPLPDDSAHAIITDPPYYYSVQYADLADFFYVWLRRSLAEIHQGLLEEEIIEKANEIIVQSPGHEHAASGKNNLFYETHMKSALADARRVLLPSGISTVVFAHTSTSGWEALLQALIDAGWVVTGSWPIDTEMSSRVIAQGRAVLGSSVHIVCRPRENPDGTVRADAVGDWRDVLTELPQRIRDWLPRLSAEGVVGADAIFACLGPALEIFSRYSRVEKASGEVVPLREYLEHVWAAVSKEALNMIFAGADATGFEEDARLTAMWLWTLSTEANGADSAASGSDEDDAEDEAPAKKGKAATGFSLEYDAARKIAQGLGAHLENLASLVEVKGSTARLLPVAERTRALFGKDQAEAPSSRRKAKKKQLSLSFGAELEEAEGETGGWGDKGVPELAKSVLDRVHQAMILFAAGRGEALRRFVVEEGAGSDERFWRLAQALSALYPGGTDEKRWVDGLLARKKGLGF